MLPLPPTTSRETDSRLSGGSLPSWVGEVAPDEAVGDAAVGDVFESQADVPGIQDGAAPTLLNHPGQKYIAIAKAQAARA